ncbi:cupin domain-containing protein [Candidatus Zixiibacteriota bacterium]
MNKVKYTRVFADSAGESHIEDLEMVLTATDFAPPAPPLNLSQFIPATTLNFLSAPPGWSGDWHPAPRRQMMLDLAGQVDGETSDGTRRRFGPGDVVLLEDTTGKGHRSRVVGDQEALIAVVQLED